LDPIISDRHAFVIRQPTPIEIFAKHRPTAAFLTLLERRAFCF